MLLASAARFARQCRHHNSASLFNKVETFRFMPHLVPDGLEERPELRRQHPFQRQVSCETRQRCDRAQLLRVGLVARCVLLVQEDDFVPVGALLVRQHHLRLARIRRG